MGVRPQPEFRFVFNSDGNGVWEDAGGNVDQWIENLFGPLEGSAVDAVFWNDGAGGNTANYDSNVLELTGERVGQVDPRLVEAIANGNDPPEVVIREARKRDLVIFYSYRVNNIHDNFLPRELPTFKILHPEWLLAEDNAPHSYALNFAVQEVVELKIQIIKEIFNNYDFDGLELDFLRSPPYFPGGTEPQYADVLTNFVLEIRRFLDDKAIERDRQIGLAVRVGESMEANYLDGFDVEEWVQEGLIDYLILGSGYLPDVPEFKRIVEGSDVRIFPTLYPHGSTGTREPGRLDYPTEFVLGSASVYWRQLTDGLYLFNFFPHSSQGSGNWDPGDTGRHHELIHRLGNLDDLAMKNAIFSVRTGLPIGQEPRPEYPHNGMAMPLPATLNGDAVFELDIYVPFDLARDAEDIDSLSLVARLDNFEDAEAIRFTVQGQDLGVRGPDAMHPYYSGPFSPGMPVTDGKNEWLSLPLEADQIRAGDNRVVIEVTGNLDLLNLEIHVKYRSQLDFFDGLIAHHSLDLGRGDGGNDDSQVEIHGATQTRDRFGNPTRAYHFSGDDFILLPNGDSEDYSLKDFTYTAWINADDTEGRRSIIDLDLSKQLLALIDGRVAIRGRCGNRASMTQVGFGWHHIVWVVAGSRFNLYVDGSQAGTGDGCSSQARGSNIVIGAGAESSQAENRQVSEAFFSGDLDEVRVYDRALTGEEIRELYNVESQNPYKAPIGVYLFDGNANDTSGQQNHGVPERATLGKDRFGNSNSAYHFTGDDFIFVPLGGENLFTFEDFTYSVWFDAEETKGWHTIIDFDNDQQLLAIADNSITVFGRCGTYASTEPLLPGWHHAVWAVSRAHYQLYLDGVSIGSGDSCSQRVSGLNLAIGAGLAVDRSSGELVSGEYFSGSIDDIRIYDRALGFEETLRIYEAGRMAGPSS